MTKHLRLLLISCLFFGLIPELLSQEFEVREFIYLNNDIEATRNPVKTINNQDAALIKVVTNIQDLRFDLVGGVVDRKNVDDGYWVYIQPNENYVTLKADGFISKEISFPVRPQQRFVYRLVVAASGNQLPLANFVRVTFRLNEPNVFIASGNSAPVQASGNNAVRQLPKGKHTFKFIKEGFQTLEKTITVESDEVFDIALEKGTSSVTLSLPGLIIINSDPPGAEVYLNNQRMTTTPYQNTHIAGNYNILLRAPLHHDYVGNFELLEGATLDLQNIRLIPKYGYWELSSVPSDAEVWLNGKKIGNAPIDKSKISSGNHELVLKSELYHDYVESFVINDGDSKTFDKIRLLEAFGKLEITSEPSGAEVFIDGRKVGTTPYVNSQQPSGTFALKLSYPLYADVNESIVIKDGEETKRFVPLTNNFGTLTVQAEGAEIFINDMLEGESTVERNLSPGKYTLKAVKKNHTTATKDVFVMVGSNETIQLNPAPIQGALTIITEPFITKGAEIYINGTKRNETSPAVLPLIIGNYQVEVKKDGYLDQAKSIEIKEGGNHQLTFEMQTFKGSLAQELRRQKNAALLYGTLTLAAAGTGTYFRLTANQLATDYETATTDATKIYGQWEDNNLYSYIAFGAAVPLGVMTIVKMTQSSKTRKKMDIAFIPVEKGGIFLLTYNF